MSGLSSNRWPVYPFWELEGFDFSEAPVAQITRSIRDALYSGRFTRRFSLKSFNLRSDTERCTVRSLNNAAVLFSAMLYCKDSFHRPAVFWERVDRCIRKQGPPVAEAIGRIFVDARRCALRGRRKTAPPSKTARLVDEWIAFIESDPNVGPGTTVTEPWDTRRREWARRRATGELMNLAWPQTQQTGDRDSPAVDVKPEPQPIETPIGSRNRPIEIKEESSPVDIKEELSPQDIWEIPDDVSLVDLGANKPESFKERKKRKEVESPSSRPAKRRANQTSSGHVPFHTVHFQNQMHSPPPSSPSAAASRRLLKVIMVGGQTSATSSERHRSDAEDGHHSTESRVVECEKRLNDQNNLTLNQDLRIGRQEDRIALHETKIEGLEFRLRSMEENLTPVEDLQESITQLTSKLNSRETYMRRLVGDRWAVVCVPFKEEQKRVGDRVDDLSNQFAVQEALLKNCQKRVEEQAEKIKEQDAAFDHCENSFTKKLRAERRRIKELNERIKELEEKMKDEEARTRVHSDEPAIKANGAGKSKDTVQLGKRLGRLSARVTKLEKSGSSTECEKRQQSTIDDILKRLRALEADHSKPKAASAVSLEERLTRQGERLGRQERTTESLRKEISNVHTELRKSYQSRTSADHRGGP